MKPTIAIVVLWLTSASLAQMSAGDLRKDLREICRSELSGKFLRAHDGFLAQSAHAKLLATNLKKQKQELHEVDKKYREFADQVAKAPYDADMERKRDAMYHMHQLLEQQIDENTKLYHLILANRDSNLAKRKHLRQQLQPLFQIEEIRKPEMHAVTYRVEYKHACPKFEMMCALPPQQAQKLRRILGPEETPIECVRYSQIMPYPNQ